MFRINTWQILWETLGSDLVPSAFFSTVYCWKMNLFDRHAWHGSVVTVEAWFLRFWLWKNLTESQNDWGWWWFCSTTKTDFCENEIGRVSHSRAHLFYFPRPPYLCPSIQKQESFCGELLSLSSQSAVWSLGEGSRESWSFPSELFFNQADVYIHFAEQYLGFVFLIYRNFSCAFFFSLFLKVKFYFL